MDTTPTFSWIHPSLLSQHSLASLIFYLHRRAYLDPPFEGWHTFFNVTPRTIQRWEHEGPDFTPDQYAQHKRKAGEKKVRLEPLRLTGDTKEEARAVTSAKWAWLGLSVFAKDLHLPEVVCSECYPKLDTVTKRTGIYRRVLQRGIHYLQEKHHVIKLKRKRTGTSKGHGYLWTFRLVHYGEVVSDTSPTCDSGDALAETKRQRGRPCYDSGDALTNEESAMLEQGTRQFSTPNRTIEQNYKDEKKKEKNFCVVKEREEEEEEEKVIDADLWRFLDEDETNKRLAVKAEGRRRRALKNSLIPGVDY